MGALNAFGGAPLVGDKWVRVLYLDESGIGKLKHDPFVVVAGVIIHADSQWGLLARRLDELLSDATPFGSKRPQFLHAKDIFHGSGEFPRDKWDLKRRNKLLDSVGALVEEFSLPVVWISIDRKKFSKRFTGLNASEQVRECYTVAAVGCFMQAEMYMRQQHVSGEVCSIVMEENRELQKRIPAMIAFMRNPGDETKNLLDGWERVMPLTKLIDTPACQPKTASSILQLADYCAFSIKRRIENKPGSSRLTHGLAGNLLRYEDPSVNDKDLREFESVFWNPVHMPSRWGFPLKFEEGKFVRKG